MTNMAQQLIRAARATIHRFEELQLGIKKCYDELRNSIVLRTEANVFRKGMTLLQRLNFLFG